jgi:hypothetical protein
MKIKNSITFKIPVYTIIAGLLLAGLAGGAWFIRPQGVMERGSAALSGNDLVNVEERKVNGAGGFLFAPEKDEKGVGFVFYPGARVPVRAYAPNALAIAERGYEVFLVKMPLNLAVLASGRAGKVISGLGEVDNWAVGGHSMGGAMAAKFVSETDLDVSGLVLWASYPPEGAEFDPGLGVLSITASEDEIIDDEKLNRAREQLPEGTEFVEIAGGNHGQFGWYGFQSGDGEAKITRENQVETVVRETTDFLSTLSEKGSGQ